MKTYLLLLSALLISTLTIAQTTAIPDTSFENTLINLGLDSGIPDGVVLTANIDTVTELSAKSFTITDLTGIEDFTSLTYLDFEGSNVSQIDISNNINLQYLECYFTPLTNLDVSTNTSLLYIGCGGCPITSLNISCNINLIMLDCFGTNMTCLNVKNGNNMNFTRFDATNNPNLACIEVDNVTYSTANWVGTNFTFDPQSSFSTNCSNPCSNPCSVGIKESSFSNLSLYPNPTTGQISLSLNDVNTGFLRVLNSLGQVVLEEEFVAVRELDIRLDGPSGLYFLQIESEGEVITKKIIKE